MLKFRSDLHETMWGSIAAFAAGAIAMVLASMREPRKTDEELHGLVYGMEIRDASDTAARRGIDLRSILGIGVLVLNAGALRRRLRVLTRRT